MLDCGAEHFSRVQGSCRVWPLLVWGCYGQREHDSTFPVWLSSQESRCSGEQAGQEGRVRKVFLSPLVGLRVARSREIAEPVKLAKLIDVVSVPLEATTKGV